MEAIWLIGVVPLTLLIIFITEQLRPTRPLPLILRVRDAVVLLAQVARAARYRLAYSFSARFSANGQQHPLTCPNVIKYAPHIQIMSPPRSRVLHLRVLIASSRARKLLWVKICASRQYGTEDKAKSQGNAPTGAVSSSCASCWARDSPA